MKNKQILFSGIKPTGTPHIGNYLGALKQWVEQQDAYACIYSIVDLHALTIDITPEDLTHNSLQASKILLGIGIDPEKSILFLQSTVKEHAELAWILNCITPVAELERMTQFKDKSKEHKHNINMGLFDYPVLMAADIMLYHAEAVPVGEDQLQHLELTRIITKKFNNRYGKYFKEPQAIISEAKKIMSLNVPEKKMSKDLGETSYISLTDAPAIIKKKVMRAVTDTGPTKTGIMAPGVKNLFELLLYFDNKDAHREFTSQYDQGKIKYAELKETVATTIINTLKPIQEKISSYTDKEVKIILGSGADKAREIAEHNLKEIKNKIGLL